MSDLFEAPRETSHLKSIPISYFAEIQGREEQRRHECEVRYVASFGTDAKRAVYLSGVYEKRGKAAWTRLRQDVWAYMQKAA